MKYQKSKMCIGKSKRNVNEIKQKSLKALKACALHVQGLGIQGQGLNT